MRKLLLALAVLVTLIVPVTQPSQAAPACTPWVQVFNDLKAHDWQIKRLTAAESKTVLADFNKETESHVEAGRLYVIRWKAGEGEELVGVVFVNHGCFLGVVKARPEHLQELLGQPV